MHSEACRPEVRGPRLGLGSLGSLLLRSICVQFRLDNRITSCYLPHAEWPVSLLLTSGFLVGIVCVLQWDPGASALAVFQASSSILALQTP
jgi:hypothetical protein